MFTIGLLKILVINSHSSPDNHINLTIVSVDNVRTFLPQNSFRVSLPGCGFVYFCGSMFTGMVGGIWILTTFFTWTKTEYCDSLIFAIVYLPFFVPRVLSMSTHFLTYSQCMEISRSSTKIRDTRSTPFSMY